jgi:membrane protein DedA with SNARE-associated domain
MGALIDNFATSVAAYPTLAVLIVLAAATIEAVALLGILIPGTPIVMAVAAAGAAAGLPTTPFVVMAILGGILGDGISFWAGQLKGRSASFSVTVSPASPCAGSCPCCAAPYRWWPAWRA